MTEVWRLVILERGGRVLETSLDGTREIQSRRFPWRGLNYLAPVVHAGLQAAGNMSGIIRRSVITVDTGISVQMTK